MTVTGACAPVAETVVLIVVIRLEEYSRWARRGSTRVLNRSVISLGSKGCFVDRLT